MISKKDLLKETNISYGQLYRWKREGLIPDEWFNKQSVSTGQETYFERNKIVPRIEKIVALKDRYQLEEMKAFFNPTYSGRVYDVRELIVISELDPFILKAYSDKKTELSLFDVIIIYIFSTNKEYLNYDEYHEFDFSSLNNLNSSFYIIELGEKYLILASELLILDPKINIIKEIKLEEVAKTIAINI